MDALKRCFKCGVEKPRSDFYTHPQMADGLLGKCKSCTKRDVKQSYREHRRARRIQATKRRLRPEVKERDTAVRKVREKTPEARRKHNARNRLKRAVRLGQVQRQPCETCGTSIEVEGHHDDHNKALDVRWLCRRCHLAEHDRVYEGPVRHLVDAREGQ